MRTAFFATILCAVVSMTQPVAADSPTTQSEPASFASISAIRAYWNANPPSYRNVVFVDGRKVNATLGFGPSGETHYFYCPAANNYRRGCDNAFDNASDWEYIMSFLSPDYTVYWDGNPVRSGSPNVRADISSCYGDTDQGFPGPIRFFRLTRLASNGTPTYVSSCPSF